jgi:hypothetical protein
MAGGQAMAAASRAALAICRWWWGEGGSNAAGSPSNHVAFPSCVLCCPWCLTYAYCVLLCVCTSGQGKGCSPSGMWCWQVPGNRRQCPTGDRCTTAGRTELCPPTHPPTQSPPTCIVR